MIHNLYFIQRIQPAHIVPKQIAIFSKIYLNFSFFFSSKIYYELFIDSNYSKLSLATGQIRLMVMTMFSYLGSISDIKTCFFAMLFLKTHICDVTAAAPYLSIDFQDVFSVPWPGKHHCSLYHP